MARRRGISSSIPALLVIIVGIIVVVTIWLTFCVANRGIKISSIAAILIVIVGLIVIISIWRNKNFLKFGPATAADPMNPQIGETLPGPNIYTCLGDIPRSGHYKHKDGFTWRIKSDCFNCIQANTP